MKTGLNSPSFKVRGDKFGPNLLTYLILLALTHSLGPLITKCVFMLQCVCKLGNCYMWNFKLDPTAGKHQRNKRSASFIFTTMMTIDDKKLVTRNLNRLSTMLRPQSILSSYLINPQMMLLMMMMVMIMMMMMILYRAASM